MKQRLFMLLVILSPFCSAAQQYQESIQRYREAYKMSLMKGDHALTPSDTGYLRFYPPNPAYCVKATFEPVTGAAPFRMKTVHGAIGPDVREYGWVYFNMNGATITLVIYRIVAPPKFRLLARKIDTGDNNVVLFIPFTDRTNYNQTFLGGRYLDISAAALQNGTVIIDFNKACNPHTAYEKGYPYVVTPKLVTQSTPVERAETRKQPTDPQMQTKLVNDIPLDIEAGEKIFGHKPGY